jgi:hypothetical protein
VLHADQTQTAIVIKASDRKRPTGLSRRPLVAFLDREKYDGAVGNSREPARKSAFSGCPCHPSEFRRQEFEAGATRCPGGSSLLWRWW